jgi:hypothetical protein
MAFEYITPADHHEQLRKAAYARLHQWAKISFALGACCIALILAMTNQPFLSLLSDWIIAGSMFLFVWTLIHTKHLYELHRDKSHQKLIRHSGTISELSKRRRWFFGIPYTQYFAKIQGETTPISKETYHAAKRNTINHHTTICTPVLGLIIEECSALA